MSSLGISPIRASRPTVVRLRCCAEVAPPPGWSGRTLKSEARRPPPAAAVKARFSERGARVCTPTPRATKLRLFPLTCAKRLGRANLLDIRRHHHIVRRGGDSQGEPSGDPGGSATRLVSLPPGGRARFVAMLPSLVVPVHAEAPLHSAVVNLVHNVAHAFAP